MLKVVHDADASNENGTAGGSLLDEIVRDGARAMLAAALQAEVAAYIDAHVGEVDENGYRLVVRNGYHGEREVLTAAGAVPVRAPRVNDKRIDAETGERQRFSSAILPAWARKSPQVAEVLPLLYLHGLSSSDFGPALEQFLGSAAGLSAATITRLTAQWQDDAEAFNKRSLTDTDYVYVWVDGIHLKVRLEQDKVCLLVMIGVRADGRKELVALADGFRESTRVVGRSAAVVPPARDDGLRCSRSATVRWGSGRPCGRCSPTPESSGAGSTSARMFLPPCRSRRTQARKPRSPRSTTPRTRDHALKAVKAFEADYGAKWPKAVAKITEHVDVLLAFYDYPAQHWIHLRTTNPIESTFATVRLRQRVTKGPGSRAAGVAMAFKLIESAQARWRAVNAPHLVALVRAGARFEKGKLVERPDESGGDQQVA